jgi:hypothetical protein
MVVGLKLGSITAEVGSSDFFHAVFSTISGNLERDGWASRFPMLLGKLYRGKLVQSDAAAALMELDQIVRELSQLAPDKVIWDIEDRSKRPPWSDAISPDITSLADYFVTSTGRELMPMLRDCLEELRDDGGTLEVVTY